MTEENMAIEKPRHSLFIPLVLIGVGVVFFFTTLGLLHMSAWDVFMKWWPVVLIIAGVDQLWQRSGSVGAVLVIGLGGLFLLGNLGAIDVSAWNVILRMWPVFVIAWGLDLLVGNKSNFAMVVGVVLGFALFIGVIWFTFYAPFSTQKALGETINQEVGMTSQLSANIDSVYGDVNLAAQADPAVLVSGHLLTAENQKVNNEFTIQDNSAVLDINSSGNFIYPVMPFGPSQTLSWDLGFNSDTLLNLDTRTVLGKQNLDLTLLRLQALKAETVMGKTVIALPRAGNFSADLNTVMGDLMVIVQKDSAVTIERNTFFTLVEMPEDFVEAEGVFQSPAAAAGATDVIHVVIDQPIGRLQVVYSE